MSERRHINPYKLFVGSFIPNWLAKRPEVSHGAKLVYARLCQYNGKDGGAYPSQARIGDDLGVSERHARTLVGELVELKLLEVESRGEGRRNVYLFPEHEWMEFDRINCSCHGNADRINSSSQPGLFIIEQIESLHTQADKPPAEKTSGKKAKAKKPVHPDLGQWFGYSKSALSEKYPGYVFEPKQDKGLRLIFEKSCKSDLVKAKAFLQCALADGDRFVTNLRHDPMFLYSNANRWLTASRGWSGFKPELDSQKAAREQARLAQVAESDRQRREAEELERVRSDLSALRPGDLETLRAAWLSTVPGDHIFRSKWAEADWRENAAVMAGIYGALKLRRKVNAGVLL